MLWLERINRFVTELLAYYDGKFELKSLMVEVVSSYWA